MRLLASLYCFERKETEEYSCRKSGENDFDVDIRNMQIFMFHEQSMSWYDEYCVSKVEEAMHIE